MGGRGRGVADRDVGGELVVAAADVLHERVTGCHYPGGPASFQPAHRPQPRLQPPMISLDTVSARRAGGRLDELRREPLHPAVHGDVLHGDAALSQQFLDVTVGKAVAQYQRTATEMTSRGNRKPANTEEERRNVTTPVSRRADRPTQHCRLAMPARREVSKDAELLALRHENAVLRRQTAGPGTSAPRGSGSRHYRS